MKWVYEGVPVEGTVDEFKELMTVFKQKETRNYVYKVQRRNAYTKTEEKLIKDTYTNPRNFGKAGKIKRKPMLQLVSKLGRKSVNISAKATKMGLTQ